MAKAKAKVTVKKITAVKKKLTNAVKKLKVKKMPTVTLEEEVKKQEKHYKVLFQKEGGYEVRIYPPAKRTVLANVGYDPHHFLQFPYLVLAYQPYGRGGYLYGCFATEDLSQMTEEQRANATVYRMPFPAQLDRGMWGPCCLLSGSPWYYVEKNFDGLVERFWLTVFRALGDYGQKTVTCWKDMSVDDVFNMLKKSTAPYRGTYANFLSALQGGTNPY